MTKNTLDAREGEVEYVRNEVLDLRCAPQTPEHYGVLIERALGILTPKQREVIVRRYLDQQSQNDIARDWGVHDQSIGHLEKRALKRMRKYLSRIDFSP